VVEELLFTINMVLTSRNRHEIAEMARLAARLGVGAVRFGHFMPTPHGADMKLDLTPEERRQADAEIRSLQPRSPIPLVLAPGYHTADLFPCGPLRGEDVNVDCYGNLTKCCHLSGPGENTGRSDTIGSLREMGLGDAWRRLVAENARFRAEKERLLRDQELLDSDFFPCWFCSQYYGKVEWLRYHPDHPWAPLMWKSTTHRGNNLVPLSQLLEKADTRS
jgi:MoaA/NifB/PqqE/SkfB family radical SAM enzyme